MDASRVVRIMVLFCWIAPCVSSNADDTEQNSARFDTLRSILRTLLESELTRGSDVRTNDEVTQFPQTSDGRMLNEDQRLADEIANNYLNVNVNNIPSFLYEDNGEKTSENTPTPMPVSVFNDDNGDIETGTPAKLTLPLNEFTGNGEHTNHVAKPALLRPKGLLDLLSRKIPKVIRMSDENGQIYKVRNMFLPFTERSIERNVEERGARPRSTDVESLLLNTLMSSHRNSRESHMFNVHARDLTWDKSCSDGYEHCGGYFPSCCEGFVCLRPITPWDIKNDMYRCLPDYFVEG